MFETIKYASYVQKGYRLDAAAMPYQKVFSMATLEGARVLGMEEEIGSLEPGKKADITIVDLKHPRFQPVLRGEFSNILANLVYSAHSDDVETVIVDGRIVMENRVIKTIDEDKALEDVARSAEKLMQGVKQFIK